MYFAPSIYCLKIAPIKVEIFHLTFYDYIVYNNVENSKEPKTYYDPTQIIDTEMVQAAKDVMRNGTLKGSRKVVGTTLLKGEEIKFEAYIKDGKFSTIYPTLKE